MSDWLNREHMLGYLDGLKAETPEPSDNRSLAYKYSFWLGRNELTDTPNPSAAQSRRRCKEIRALEQPQPTDYVR